MPRRGAGSAMNYLGRATTATAAANFLQAHFPLHSGRIVGMTGRVIMSAMGLIVALLSVTGVVIWARKRRARRTRKAESAAVAGALTRA